MNRRSAVLAIVAFVGDVARSIAAGTTPWNQRSVEVIDRGPSHQNENFSRTFAAINRAMPPSGPRFRYRRGGTRPCEDQDTIPGAIVICTIGGVGGGWANPGYGKGNVLNSYKVGVSGNPDVDVNWDAGLACHESMHAVTDVSDRYQFQFDSCVHGYEPELGKYDKALLKKLYGKKRRRK